MQRLSLASAERLERLSLDGRDPTARTAAIRPAGPRRDVGDPVVGPAAWPDRTLALGTAAAGLAPRRPGLVLGPVAPARSLGEE